MIWTGFGTRALRTKDEFEVIFWITLSYSGQPTKSTYGLKSRTSNLVLIELVLFKIWKFCKFGLKRLFMPPKFTFWGVLTPKCYFSLLRPPKGNSLAGNTRFESSLVAAGRAVRPGRWAKNTKQQNRAMATKPRDAAAVRCGLKFADIHYEFKSSQAPKTRLQSYRRTGAK